MDISLFDFVLPETSIALRPCTPRDHARQLIIDPQSYRSVIQGLAGIQDNPGPGIHRGDNDLFIDDYVYNLVDKLKAGDVLVLNDTRVIPSRLFGTIGTARVEVTLHKRIDTYSWWAFMKNARRAGVDKIVNFGHDLTAHITEKLDDGQVRLAFNVPDGGSMEGALATVGQMPLPPYIASKRDIDEADSQDYQTIYGKREGAVAAPTAGLHFTPELIAAITNKGVRVEYVTLHVGAGTFLPMKVQDTKDHKMHAEWGEVTPDMARTLNDAHAAGGRIVAVGTTSLRILESATDESGYVQPFSGDTSIFITPGYKFRAVDMLMTNFHLPKSTLFMLVSAFAGLDVMQAAYAYAIEKGYRFYSYGDSSLIYRARE